jgi:signal transduction histidine kinase
MDILDSAAVAKRARWRFELNSSASSRFLLFYACLLGLGVLGDIIWCELRPSAVLWGQILPELHYFGILFVAIRLGPGFGLAGACVAAVLHTTAVAMTCGDADSQIGRVVMFAAAGLIAAWATKYRSAGLGAENLARSTAESVQTPLSELGRMMPEVVQQFLTPIASIEGAGYLLEESDLSDERRQEFINIIRKECRRLEILVELLDFTQSRFSAYEEANIPMLIDEVIERCRAAANSRIVLLNGTDQNLPRLRCDPELIKYALQTLTMGAIRGIAHEGDIEVSAKLTAGQIVVHIKTRAEGLTPPLNSTLNDPGGIDLALVQQIVNRHHGSMRTAPSGEAMVISVNLPLRPE